jgi:hypothetical protein
LPYWPEVDLPLTNFHIHPKMLKVVLQSGGAGNSCLSHGGAIMFNPQARQLACWTRAKGNPQLIRLGVPPYDQKAQGALGECEMRSHSITLLNGAFTCIGTPVAVQRASARWTGGVPGKHLPIGPATGYGRPGSPFLTCASVKCRPSYTCVQPGGSNAKCEPNPRDKYSGR